MIQNQAFLDEVVDVVISGAGIVGSILALRLQKQGMNVVVIESKSLQTSNEHNDKDIDPRTLAITPASKIVLDSIGIWKKIPPEKIGAFKTINVWDQMGDGAIEFDTKNSLQSHLGYIVEQVVIESSLSHQLLEQDDIHVYQSTSINSIEFQPAYAMVSLNNGRNIKTKLIVAADGAHSTVRDMAGISYLSDSYEQTAIAGVVKTQAGHAQIARQRFLENGILALLPLYDVNHCGFVWSTDDEYAEYLKSMDNTQFCRNMSIASESVIGDILDCYSRQTFPLSSAQASEYCDHRVVLIGDAAHRVHPLAGQGANLGIMDAEVLSHEIITLHQQKRDFGLKAYLRRYERKRRSENVLMMNVFSGFKSLFENQTFPVPFLRNSGMSILNKIEPIKQCIIHKAMGLTGDVPEHIKTPLSF